MVKEFVDKFADEVTALLRSSFVMPRETMRRLLSSIASTFAP